MFVPLWADCHEGTMHIVNDAVSVVWNRPQEARQRLEIRLHEAELKAQRLETLHESTKANFEFDRKLWQVRSEKDDATRHCNSTTTTTTTWSNKPRRRNAKACCWTDKSRSCPQATPRSAAVGPRAPGNETHGICSSRNTSTLTPFLISNSSTVESSTTTTTTTGSEILSSSPSKGIIIGTPSGLSSSVLHSSSSAAESPEVSCCRCLFPPVHG